MTKKRNRTRPALSLQEARDTARRLPAGAERHMQLQKVRNGEAAAEMERWLSSPGLQNPK